MLAKRCRTEGRSWVVVASVVAVIYQGVFKCHEQDAFNQMESARGRKLRCLRLLWALFQLRKQCSCRVDATKSRSLSSRHFTLFSFATMMSDDLRGYTGPRIASSLAR